jgi:TetR/AcrR family transcriptional regulator
MKTNQGQRNGGRKGPAEPGNDSVRQRLLTAATELFTRKGYAATTVREIVASAGVTKPVLYYYFRNKEGIYLELIRKAFANLDNLLEASSGEQGTARYRLLRFCLKACSLFRENLDAARLIYAIYYGPQQGAPFFDFDSYHHKFQQALRGLVEEGVRKGEFPPELAEEITWLTLGAVNVAMEVELSHPELSMGQEGLTRVLGLIFDRIPAGQRGPKKERAR